MKINVLYDTATLEVIEAAWSRRKLRKMHLSLGESKPSAWRFSTKEVPEDYFSSWRKKV